MKIEKLRGLPLSIALIVVLLLSCYVQFGYIQNFSEYKEFLIKLQDSAGNLNFIFFVGAFLFQLIIMFALIAYEVMLLHFIIYFFYKKRHYLKDIAHPVMLSLLVSLILNIGLNLFFLSSVYDLQTLKRFIALSPVNYLVKPFILCYLLSKKNIVPNTILDWLKVGLIYVIFTCIPGMLFLFIF